MPNINVCDLIRTPPKTPLEWVRKKKKRKERKMVNS